MSTFLCFSSFLVLFLSFSYHSLSILLPFSFFHNFPSFSFPSISSNLPFKFSICLSFPPVPVLLTLFSLNFPFQNHFYISLLIFLSVHLSPMISSVSPSVFLSVYFSPFPLLSHAGHLPSLLYLLSFKIISSIFPLLFPFSDFSRSQIFPLLPFQFSSLSTFPSFPFCPIPAMYSLFLVNFYSRIVSCVSPSFPLFCFLFPLSLSVPPRQLTLFFR